MPRRHRLLALSVQTGCALVAPAAFAQDVQPPPPMSAPQPGQVPATNEQAQQAETHQRLDEAERKDSGRKFELFWLDGQIGGSYINMKQFSSETFSIENASAGGPSFGIGAGVRLVVFVAGARLRHHALSSFNMWQINAEAGLKVPIGNLDLLFQLNGGYSFVGRLGDAGGATSTNTPLATDSVSIRGFNAGLEFGLDYYVSPVFSVGAGVLADFLLLNRPAVAIPAGLTDAQRAAIQNDPLYQSSGTSAGLQLTGGLRLGLPFGI